MHHNDNGLALSHSDWLDHHHAVKSPMRASLIYQLGFSCGEKVLEIGCGAGNWTFIISDYIGHKGHISAIDIDVESITIANNRQKVLAKKNITFKKSSLNNFLKSNRDQFDTILVFNTLSYLETPRQVILDSLKKLRPGGRIIIKDTDIASDTYWPICPEMAGKVKTLLLKATKDNITINHYDPLFARKLPSIFNSLNNISINTYPQSFTSIKPTNEDEMHYIQQNATLISKVIKHYTQDDDLLSSWSKMFVSSENKEFTIFDSEDFMYSMTEFVFEIKKL
jgi:ubiquinone/menaquinone biosynthesis C-methylase UbiE